MSDSSFVSPQESPAKVRLPVSTETPSRFPAEPGSPSLSTRCEPTTIEIATSEGVVEQSGTDAAQSPQVRIVDAAHQLVIENPRLRSATQNSELIDLTNAGVDATQNDTVQTTILPASVTVQQKESPEDPLLRYYLQKISELETANVRTVQEVKDLEARLSRCEQDKANVEDQLACCRHDLSDQLSRYKHDLNDQLSRHKDNMNDQISRYRQEIRDLRSRLDLSQQKSEMMKAQFYRCDQENADLKRANANLYWSKADLQRENEDLKSRSLRYNQEKVNLEDLVDRLRKDNADMDRYLQQLKRERDDALEQAGGGPKRRRLKH
ncbi:hypothetical protein FB446DRAFT_789388 [Lentinula raphanica]|nr:hypothetical protein FB446DRAFT_789388 [Lentinula raphanica]